MSDYLVKARLLLANPGKRYSYRLDGTIRSISYSPSQHELDIKEAQALIDLSKAESMEKLAKGVRVEKRSCRCSARTDWCPDCADRVR